MLPYNKFIFHVEWDHLKEMRVYTSILDIKKSAWLIFKYAYKRGSGLMSKETFQCLHLLQKEIHVINNIILFING